MSAPSHLPDTAFPTYREHLRPAWWLWLAPIGAGLFLGIAYLFALGTLAGIATFAVIFALGAWTLVRASTQVVVEPDGLRAGRALLPWRFVGDVRTLDTAQTAAARLERADANAFTLIRSSYSKQSVAVAVTDPRDPHPYWLITTRRPHALASAIVDARAAAAREPDRPA